MLTMMQWGLEEEKSVNGMGGLFVAMLTMMQRGLEGFMADLGGKITESQCSL